LKAPPKPKPPWERDYDERVYHRGFRGFSNTAIGVVVLAVALAAGYLALAKTVKLPPFAPQGTSYTALFAQAATLSTNSPVRIAGVNVGSVTAVSPHGSATEVSFKLADEGQPLHIDASVEIRPRLFLEGNYFLDLTPGSPSAPALDAGGTIPITQTATAVQLDEILTALQTPDRENLQELLEGFGTALTFEPGAAADRTQDPDVRGKTAAEAINESFRHGGPAGRDSAIVGEALLGRAPHDFSSMIAAQRDVFAVLADREASLQQLIVSFDVFAGALATESANLAATIRELAPTLERADPALLALNDSFPPLRAFANSLEPSLRPLAPTIDVARPWLEQAQPLLSGAELGGIAQLLRSAAPDLALAASRAPALFGQLELASRCTSEVLVPTGNVVIDGAGGSYPITSGQPNIRELFYSVVGMAGESQSFDGNGSFLRFQPGGGPTLVEMPNPGGPIQDTKLFAHTIAPPQGTRPLLPANLPPYRPDVACHTNTAPNLNSAPVGPPLPAEVTP
jgi:ABC-type transporter Mla subunit MlaD